MDAIKEWVRNLVLLVLLASCLELLLPMGGMKKYVKMTMGLLIVLATLRPIFGLLGQQVTVDSHMFDTKDEQSLPTMAQILSQANDFRQKNDALAADEVKTGLAAEAARAARSVAGVADAQATVDLAEAGGETKIKRVVVTVTPGTPGGVQPVAPVTPVRPAGPGNSGATPGEPLSAAEQKLGEAVRQAVAVQLGLQPDPGVIRVVMEHRPETQRR